MNKIVKALLEAKFPTVNVDDLLEIVNATPNPIVATEVLCGLYKQPDIPEKAKDSHSEVNRTFISFDKYTDLVEYSFNRRKYKEIWVLKTEADKATFETPDVKGYYKSEKATAVGLTEEEFDKQYTKVLVYGDIDNNVRISKMNLNNWLLV